jgi:hypothetical protein
MAEALGDPKTFNGDEALSMGRLWQLDRRKAFRGRSE